MQAKEHLHKESKQHHFFGGKIPYAIIGIFSFLLYFNTVFNQYNLDDELVTSISAERPHRLTSKGISAIPEIFTEPYYKDEQGYAYDYRPLVLTTFAIEQSLFGSNPHISHLLNVLFYTLLCLLLLLVLRVLLDSYHPLLPFLITLLFAAHPIHTEVVASIKNRDEILSLAGGLGALYFFAVYINRKVIPALFAGILCFALGMLSKQSIISFAILIPVVITLFLKPGFIQILIGAAALAATSYPFMPTMFIDERIMYAGGAVLVSVSLWGLKNEAFQKILSSRKEKHSESEKTHSGRPDNIGSAGDSGKPGTFRLSPRGFVIALASAIIISFALVLLKSRYFPLPALALFGLYFITSEHYKKFYIWLCLLAAVAFSVITKSEDVYKFLFLYFSYILIIEDKQSRFRNLLLLSVLFLSGFLFMEILKNFSTLIISFILFITSFQKIMKWAFAGITVVSLAIQIINWQTLSAFDYVYALAYDIAILFIFFIPKRKFISHLYFSITLFFLYPFVLPDMPLQLQGWHYNSPVVDVNIDSYRPMDFAETVTTDQTPFTEKLGTGMMIVGKYMKLSLIPYPMSFYYGYRVIDKSNIFEPLPLLILLLLITLSVAALRVMKTKPLLTASWLIFIISLLPLANIIRPVPGMMADRFLFIPSLGFCMFLALLLVSMIDLKKLNPTSLFALPGTFKSLTLAILITYSGLTLARNRQWHNASSLMQHDIRHLGKSAQAHNLLASSYLRKALATQDPNERNKLLADAEKNFAKAIAIYPDFFNASYDLGRIRMMLGKQQEAEMAFMRAAELDSTFSDPFFQIGLIKTNRGECREALPYYLKFMKMNPAHFDVMNNLTYCYLNLKEFENAISIMKQAHQIFPQRIEPVLNLSKIYLDMGDAKNAAYYIQLAEKIAPRHPDIRAVKNALEKMSNP